MEELVLGFIASHGVVSVGEMVRRFEISEGELTSILLNLKKTGGLVGDGERFSICERCPLRKVCKFKGV